jgi:SAM-dependent methyltransferase
MNWEQLYLQGDTHWDRGAPAPALVQYLSRHPLAGRALVPGCGTGHDVALLAQHGLSVTGLDIAPTGLAKARAQYPALPPETWVLGDLFALPAQIRGAFDFVIEHTCLSAMPPALRPAYREAITSALRPGGRIIGVWFINPDLDPGEEGPPYPLSLAELDALFSEGFEIIDDYVPDVAYPGREGRERVRVLRLLPP